MFIYMYIHLQNNFLAQSWQYDKNVISFVDSLDIRMSDRKMKDISVEISG